MFGLRFSFHTVFKIDASAVFGLAVLVCHALPINGIGWDVCWLVEATNWSTVLTLWSARACRCISFPIESMCCVHFGDRFAKVNSREKWIDVVINGLNKLCYIAAAHSFLHFCFFVEFSACRFCFVSIGLCVCVFYAAFLLSLLLLNHLDLSIFSSYLSIW